MWTPLVARINKLFGKVCSFLIVHIIVIVVYVDVDVYAYVYVHGHVRVCVHVSVCIPRALACPSYAAKCYMPLQLSLN